MDKLSTFLCLLVAVVLAVCVVVMSTDIWQNEQALTDPNLPQKSALKTDLPPLLGEIRSRTDELGFDQFVSRSTIEAETFRQSILRPDSENSRGSIDRTRQADLIGKACVEFVKSNSTASVNNVEEALGYNLSRFTLSAEQIVSAIAGDRDIPDPEQFYGSFEGKWFGIWDKNEVDHHWGPYVALDPVSGFKVPGGEPVILNGFQYAWIGDGYGINHVASSKDGSKNFLLGYVIHLREEDIEQETARRPHVGVVDGTDRLIWVTKGEVFFEEMISGDGTEADRYYITGFRYKIEKDKEKSDLATKILKATEAFQVVYSRKSDQRKPWRGFEIDLNVR